MKDFIVRGRTSNIAFVFLPDSTSTTGAGKTGLTNASAGLIISVRREKSTAMTAYSGANIGTISTLGTWANPGTGKVNIKEVDATNAPGMYELHFEDAILNTSDTSRKLVGMVQATGVVPTPFELVLIAVDFQDGMRAALTALPNAAAEASGGLPTLSAAQASNGTIQANVHRWLTGTPNALQSGRVDGYLGAVASGVIAAASFAANALDAVWSTATRILTAGTNIVLAKGTGVTGFNDLDDAGVRSAVGLASANLDTQLTAIDDYIDTEVSAIKAKTDNLPSDPADASDIAASFSTVNSTLSTIAAYIDTEVAAIKAKTDNLPSDPADASDIAASFSSIASTLTTIASYIDTEVAAIKAKTDNLPTDPADASDIAASFSTVNSTLSTISGYLDTEIATLIDATARLLGLQGKHVRLESPTFDVADNILTYTLNVYDTGAHATAGGATGLLYQYSVTNTYSGGNLATSVTTQVS